MTTSDAVARSITFLNKAGRQETVTDWEETDRGVIIPVGAASEVLIPWHRVLEVWNERGKTSRANGKGNVNHDG